MESGTMKFGKPEKKQESNDPLILQWDSSRPYIFLGNRQYLKLLYDGGNCITCNEAIAVAKVIVSRYNGASELEERNRELLEALEELYSFSPDIPEGKGVFETGLVRAIIKAKTAITKSRSL